MYVTCFAADARIMRATIARTSLGLAIAQRIDSGYWIPYCGNLEQILIIAISCGEIGRIAPPQL